MHAVVAVVVLVVVVVVVVVRWWKKSVLNPALLCDVMQYKNLPTSHRNVHTSMRRLRFSPASLAAACVWCAVVVLGILAADRNGGILDCCHTQDVLFADALTSLSRVMADCQVSRLYCQPITSRVPCDKCPALDTRRRCS